MSCWSLQIQIRQSNNGIEVSPEKFRSGIWRIMTPSVIHQANMPTHKKKKGSNVRIFCLYTINTHIGYIYVQSVKQVAGWTPLSVFQLLLVG